ncbi:uncharacterized protein LACBIDRAFT_303921 [Laccaria bicolor S238N-H82]|uniref:Predicted protein n=1 Tax=Laccaria bicolor (strain S238N-H82 / ATCC MYA-4686) TaxID=486041 RepID=B0DJY9_LACBS|nr:uncharacterized protein LACBIDRAFT_303921 [Laccaria bicolor S238N-H82]EDR05097.1 predicted protein [Laccaria bicolor S238N-H82]|eukprot:XP_001884487.1 predicted protein [Laccaria bicolor S238N-H82]
MGSLSSTVDGPKDAQRVMSLALFGYFKPTVNGKLSPPQLPDSPPPSAVAIRLLPPNPNFCSNAPL